MTKSISILLIIGLGLGWSCVSTSPSKITKPQGDTFSEDLSLYRATPLEPDSVKADSMTNYVQADSSSLAVNERLDIVLDTAAVYAQG